MINVKQLIKNHKLIFLSIILMIIEGIFLILIDITKNIDKIVPKERQIVPFLSFSIRDGIMLGLFLIFLAILMSFSFFYQASKFYTRDERLLKIMDKSWIYTFYIVMLIQSQLVLIEILTNITFPATLVFIVSIVVITPIMTVAAIIQQKIS